MIEQEFRERVRTLVNWGQLPVLALSFVVVFGVSVAYKSQIAGELAAAFAVAGCSLVFSLIASTISFKYEKSATALLYCSLVFSVLYVHFLINLTGSTYSPFHHVYLYMPAVVVMVTRSRFAEIACMLAVFVSFLMNDHSTEIAWDEWSTFTSTRWGQHFAHFWFLFLLIFLTIVNSRIERISRPGIRRAPG